MPVDVGTELDRAYQDLRGIESELATLSGRSGQGDRTRRVISMTGGQELSVGFDNNKASGALGDRVTRRRVVNVEPSNDRRVQEVGGRRRIVISTDNNNGDSGPRKRSHHDSTDHNFSSSYQPPAKRTLQSSVVMPTIETKSRDATISEMKKTEKTGDAVRNRRMFSNLLVGTLKQFQKEENIGKDKVQAQFDKQREVERRLEMTDKENKTKIFKEKEELMSKRREKEQQIQLLKRKKAIVQYAEEKQKHLRRLQCFIQTTTKPPLFFLPAKHTLRTLELLKDSSRKVESLIQLRRQEMERELRRDENHSSDEDEAPAGGLKSVVSVSRNSTDHRRSSASAVKAPKFKKELSSESSEEGELNGKEEEEGENGRSVAKKSGDSVVATQPTVPKEEPEEEAKEEEELDIEVGA